MALCMVFSPTNAETGEKKFLKHFSRYSSPLSFPLPLAQNPAKTHTYKPMLPWWRKPGNHASATMPCQQLPSPTLHCVMAGVRWSSPSLLINTRGGTGNLREEFWGNQQQILGVGIFWRREERPVEKKKKA